MLRLLRVLAALSLVGVAGCGGCGRTAAPNAIPADVNVLVEHEGKPSMRIDAALLTRTPPDITEPPWRGWKLTTLVPDWDANAAVDIDDDEGFHSPLIRPGEPAEGKEPMLLLGPGGETRVIRVAPGHPITAHQGAARIDSGRTRHVQRIRLRSQESALGDRDASLGPAISLKVLVGDTPRTWTRSELGMVKPIVLMSKDGDGERDAWSLRELASTLVARDAVVVEAVGEGNRIVQIDAAKWKDPTIVPVLRANRRGRLKFVWLTKDLEETHDDQVRGVTELHLRAL